MDSPMPTIYQTYNDEQLLLLMAKDDEAAFEVIYDRYWLSLYDAAYQRLKDSGQSEDIVQDIFVKLWTRREELEINNLSAYLHTAVRNCVLNYLTRNVVSKYFFEPFENITVANSSDADELLKERELLELCRSYVNSLPKKRREVFLLHIESRLSTQRISELLGISRKTVQNHLALAMHGLRSEILPVIFLILINEGLCN